MPSLSENPLISGVIVDGVINLTPGTATTGMTIRVRRGSLTGALVGPAQQLTPTAGSPASHAFSAYDTAPVSGQPYVVTMQAAGATAASTANYAVATATAA